jgi:Tfp pilus assembly major pilin PilA
MNVGNYILTAEADAQYGKVPGRCETAYDFTINWATIATKGGGHIKVEWGFGSANEAGDAPSSAVTIKSYERFFTEKKDVAMASVSADVTTPSYTSKISGLEYLGNGTTVTVTTSNITDSQYKTAASTKRLVVTAAGTTEEYNTSELTLVSGEVTKSDAVYKLDGDSSKSNVISLGTDGNGSAAIKAKPYGAAEGTERSATSVANFWGSIPTSSATVEKFGVESGTGGYRMKTPTSTSADFVSTEDVTEHSIDVNGTDCCSAVCQYGKLYHPASAAPDAKGKSYTTTKPACFIRTFTGSKPNTFKLEGINLIQSGKVQVWWKDGNNWYDLSTPVSGSVAHTNAADSKSDTIIKTILTSDGETSRTDMLIAIVVQPGAKYIGPITATFA